MRTIQLTSSLSGSSSTHRSQALGDGRRGRGWGWGVLSGLDRELACLERDDVDEVGLEQHAEREARRLRPLVADDDLSARPRPMKRSRVIEMVSRGRSGGGGVPQIVGCVEVLDATRAQQQRRAAVQPKLEA